MPWRGDDPHRRVAERDRVAVAHGDVVARERRERAELRPRAHVLPIGHAHDDARAEGLLQIGGAAEVIVVRMADDHVLDVGRVEAELAHAADDGVRAFISSRARDDAVALASR